MIKNSVSDSKIRHETLFLLISTILFTSCNHNSTGNKNDFFYSDKEKTELIISGDTLGLLLYESVILPDGKTKSLARIKKYADSILVDQGFKSAGYLNNSGIKLVVTPKKTNSRTKLEAQAELLASGKNKSFITNSGYLARIKMTNKPVLITNDIILHFKNGTSIKEINSLLDNYKFAKAERNNFDTIEYLISVNTNKATDALSIAQQLKEVSIVKFAQVDMIYIKLYHEDTENYYPLQWNLNNENELAVPDADVDAPEAWTFTKGNESTIIAFLDDGFDVTHEDLYGNMSYNMPEKLGTDDDDEDRNGLLNDTIGWDFTAPDGGSADLEGGAHGTKVIGVAAAIERNNIGIAGICPECKILPIKSGREGGEGAFSYDKKAIDYAIYRGAKVINCSWELNGFLSVSDVIKQAIENAELAGVVVVCSMTNSHMNYCESIPDLSSVDQVISVSRSTCNDMYDFSGYGNCMDLLAPTKADLDARGDLNLVTTDQTGEKPDNVGADLCDKVCDNYSYTFCFRGTSASAPLVSGIAGLVFSLNPNITPKQIRYLLQDCADKIDTTHGHYSRKNGYSNFEIPDTFATHGYGRVNAYEAVKIAAPIERGGRSGVDIFLRDNILDWGNTEQPSNVLFDGNPRGHIGHYRSQDIKVDAPNGTGIAPITSIEFENFIDEKPISEKNNKVYVRVHNRGYKIAREVHVKLYWVYGGLALPPLWSTFPNDLPGDATWNFLGSVTLNNLEYSGASVAYSSADKSQIATFNFTAPPHPAGTRNHYCLAALIDSPEDPLNVPALADIRLGDGTMLLDDATPRFNNITHRNYSLEISSDTGVASDMLRVRNPFPMPVPVKITVKNPKQINVLLSGVLVDSVFVMPPKSEKTLTVKIDRTHINYPAEFTIEQEFILPGKKKKKIFGGFTFYFTQ